MKQLLSLLFLTASLISYSQEVSKKNYYLLDNQKIPEELFETLDKKKIFTRKVENDTAVIKYIYRRKNFSQLDSTQHVQTKKILSKITNFDFDENVKTMIHLYKNDEQIYKDAEYKKYWRWIKKNSDRYQAFLIGTRNSGVQAQGKKHIYLDSYDFLNNVFFENSDFEINHLLIKPTGEIYVYYGINDILHVLDWSVD